MTQTTKVATAKSATALCCSSVVDAPLSEAEASELARVISTLNFGAFSTVRLRPTEQENALNRSATVSLSSNCARAQRGDPATDRKHHEESAEDQVEPHPAEKNS